MSNTITTDEKILDRVAKLLALAEHPNTPAPEAEVALLQAHKLMAKHAIEEALVRQKQTVGERRALLRMDIEVGGGYTFRPYLRTILDYNAEANRCSVAHMFSGKAAIFGADEDVRWVAMLHQMIHLQFLSKIEPKWDNDKSYDENVYNFKVAGYKWKDIEAQAVRNGHEKRESHEHRTTIPAADVEDRLRYWMHDEYIRVPKEDGSVEIRIYNGFFHKLKAAYKRHAKLIGDTSPVTTQSHEAYRLSYAAAFRTTMARRFRQMIREAESERDTIPGAALALRDMQEEANRMMWDAFPDLDPEVVAEQRRRMEEQWAREAKEREEMLAAMTPKQRETFLEKEEREQRRAAKRSERYWERNTVRLDQGAHDRGAQAAASVDLTRKAGSAGAASSRQEIR